MADPPTWTEMLGRMAAVSFRTATGTLAWRDPDKDDSDQAGAVRFWYRQPDSLRLDDEFGLRVLTAGRSGLVRDIDGRMQEVGAAAGGGQGDPRQLFGGRQVLKMYTRRNDYSVPHGPAEEIEMLGRRAWRFVLEPPPHKEHPLALVVDDQTGALLEIRSTGIDAFTTLTDFEPDGAIDDSIFTYDGPVATDWADERRRREEIQERGREMQWPTPRYWPRGVPLHLLDADFDTGAFVGLLEVPPDSALLARWPPGTPTPEALSHRSPPMHLHQWSREGWSWALAVSEPLEPGELEKLIESIPSIDGRS